MTSELLFPVEYDNLPRAAFTTYSVITLTGPFPIIKLLMGVVDNDEASLNFYSVINVTLDAGSGMRDLQRYYWDTAFNASVGITKHMVMHSDAPDEYVLAVYVFRSAGAPNVIVEELARLFPEVTICAIYKDTRYPEYYFEHRLQKGVSCNCNRIENTEV